MKERTGLAFGSREELAERNEGESLSKRSVLAAPGCQDVYMDHRTYCNVLKPFPGRI